MKYLFALIVSLALTGCGATKIDPNFRPFLNDFQAVAAAHGASPSYSHLVMEFSSDVAGGNCQSLLGDHTIRINPTIWDGMGEDERRALIFHELGHCVLGKHHNTEMVGECPKSLMYPHTPSGGCLQQMSAYDDELFD